MPLEQIGSDQSPLLPQIFSLLFWFQPTFQPYASVLLQLHLGPQNAHLCPELSCFACLETSAPTEPPGFSASPYHSSFGGRKADSPVPPAFPPSPGRPHPLYTSLQSSDLPGPHALLGDCPTPNGRCPQMSAGGQTVVAPRRGDVTIFSSQMWPP